MFFMSSSLRKKARTSSAIPCPGCGRKGMKVVVESCTLRDGTRMTDLKQYKCGACHARYFDDEAMHRIQAQRGQSRRTALVAG